MGRGAPVRRLSGAAAGARGSIPMPSEPPLAAETGHERPADMPNQHLGWNSVTRRPLAPPRPDWPVRRGLPSNPSATATRERRPPSPRPTLRAISARIVIAITRLLRRPARCAHPARLPRRFSALAVVESGQRGLWLHRGNGCSVRAHCRQAAQPPMMKASAMRTPPPPHPHPQHPPTAAQRLRYFSYCATTTAAAQLRVARAAPQAPCSQLLAIAGGPNS